MSAKDWYLRQSQRDRLIVVGLAALIVASLVYAMVWHPLTRGLQQNREAVVKNQTVINQMLGSEVQAKALKGSGGSPVKKTSKAPYLLVDEIIRKLGMKNPDRVEPIGSTGARVNFTTVEFDKLILALGELEQYGMRISTLNVSRKEAGMVSARIRIDKI